MSVLIPPEFVLSHNKFQLEVKANLGYVLKHGVDRYEIRGDDRFTNRRIVEFLSEKVDIPVPFFDYLKTDVEIGHLASLYNYEANYYGDVKALNDVYAQLAGPEVFPEFSWGSIYLKDLSYFLDDTSFIKRDGYFEVRVPKPCFDQFALKNEVKILEDQGAYVLVASKFPGCDQILPPLYYSTLYDFEITLPDRYLGQKENIDESRQSDVIDDLYAGKINFYDAVRSKEMSIYARQVVLSLSNADRKVMFAGLKRYILASDRSVIDVMTRVGDISRDNFVRAYLFYNISTYATLIDGKFVKSEK